MKGQATVNLVKLGSQTCAFLSKMSAQFRSVHARRKRVSITERYVHFKDVI